MNFLHQYGIITDYGTFENGIQTPLWGKIDYYILRHVIWLQIKD